MTALEKPSVLNPLTLRNRVGEELADMFEARGIDNFEELIRVKNLRSKEELSEKAIRKAADILGGANVQAYLAGFQNDYLEQKPRYEASYKEAKKAFTKLKGMLPLLRGEFTDGYDILDDILDFFGVDSETEIFDNSEKEAALFRKQNNTEVDAVNLHAWLRRGELDFQKLNLPEYNEVGLLNWVESREWNGHIEDVEYFKSLPSLFTQFGVGLVFVPSLPKTVYGAIRWIDDKPLIQISDRGRDLASCWFTLFHEVGHAIKHRNVDIYEGAINETKAEQSKREREANKFANDYLFNGDDLRKAVFNRKRTGLPMTAKSLAEEFRVQPIFASYWLLKAQVAPSFQRRISIDFVSQYQ